MIKTKFNHIIENDTLHGSFVMKGNNIGILQLWSWNNCYLFLDIKNGKKIKIPLNRTNNLIFLKPEGFKEKYNSLYNPSDIFNNLGIFNSDKFVFNEAKIKFGSLHNKNLKILFDYSTNKLWTYSFCRTIANIKATYDFEVFIIKNYGDNSNVPMDKGMEILNMFFHSKDKSDVYNKTYNGLTDEKSITEKEITEILQKAKKLDDSYQGIVYPDKIIKMTSPDIKLCKEEIKFYLNV